MVEVPAVVSPSITVLERRKVAVLIRIVLRTGSPQPNCRVKRRKRHKPSQGEMQMLVNDLDREDLGFPPPAPSHVRNQHSRVQRPNNRHHHRTPCRTSDEELIRWKQRVQQRPSKILTLERVRLPAGVKILPCGCVRCDPSSGQKVGDLELCQNSPGVLTCKQGHRVLVLQLDAEPTAA